MKGLWWGQTTSNITCIIYVFQSGKISSYKNSVDHMIHGQAHVGYNISYASTLLMRAI